MTIVEDWTTTAACQGVDIDLFFDEARTVEARRLCLGCPARASCLEAAVAREEPCGVWGGLTAHEREFVGARRIPKSALVVHACGTCDAPLTFPLSPLPSDDDAPAEGSFAADGLGGLIVHRGDLRRRSGAEVHCPAGHDVGDVVPGSLHVRLWADAVSVRSRTPLPVAAEADAA